MAGGGDQELLIFRKCGMGRLRDLRDLRRELRRRHGVGAPLFGLLLVVHCFCHSPVGLAESASVEFFEKKIRPLLVTHCYECHAEEASADSANLRLDYRSGWLTGGDSGPVVDLRHPGNSLLLQAVSYDDPDLQMPPKGKLPERERDLLKQWIEAGAPAPDDPMADSAPAVEEFDLAARRAGHWAWRPIERTTAPAVQQSSWPSDELDRFVLAKLEESGLLPAQPADRATWLRRVTYDLTGLPPSVGELNAFLANDTPEAYQRTVDRLLANQAFGECWGQHWLDLVRFAETKGHEQDYPIPHAWRYRDYVVRALNDGLPYDQFVVEHIAGDLLPEPRIDPQTRTNQSIQATGYWHLGEATHSPVDIRGDEADRIDNQIDVFGKTFLGMTIACARCHEHKFDAISIKDYYALCGFLQSSSYQEANIADPLLRGKLYSELAALNEAASENLLALYRRQVLPRLRGWLDARDASGLRESLGEEFAAAIDQADHPLHFLAVAVGAEIGGQDVADAIRPLVAGAAEAAETDRATSAANLRAVVDFSRAAAEPLHYADWRTSGFGFGNGPMRAGAILLRGTDDQPPLRVTDRPAATNEAGSSRFSAMYRTRTFEVTRPALWTCYRGEADIFLAVDSHRTVEGPLHAICKQVLERVDDWKWHGHQVDDYLGHRVHLEFKPKGPFGLAAVGFAEQDPTTPVAPNAAVGRAIGQRQPKSVREVALATIAALESAFDSLQQRRLAAGDAQLLNWLLANDDLLPPAATTHADAYEAAISGYQARRQSIESQLPSPQYALALLDGNGENERVHLRGNHKRLADEPTTRSFLRALDGQFETPRGSGRLELARRVVDPANPLTARVMVNRIWTNLTGQGIVKTVDNFGVLGDRPTHPELLDYLAAEFIGNGWSIKQLIRRVVLSSSYRQSCLPNPQLRPGRIAETDPANNLLHRSRVRRISAEAVRDTLLAVSGELDSRRFGKSVPIHLTPFMRHNRSPKESGPADGERRRSIYVEYRRNALSHFLTAFDKPQPFTTVGRRNQSNSPAQSLMLLNDPLVHALAGKWATRLTSNFSDDAAAIDSAYLAAFGRNPSDDERASIVAHIQDRIVSGAQPEANRLAREIAWRDVCLVLFNSKEFIFLR